MPAVKAHVWTFRSQFRAGAFGWQSDLPIKRIKEAVAEIKKTARNDRVLGAEGAVIFLEKVSGALVRVDSSSGAIGTAVNRAIETRRADHCTSPGKRRRERQLARAALACHRG